MTVLLNALPLGLNPIEILIHLFNLAILMVAIRFLLYKPIKKFIDKRAADYIEVDEKSNSLKKEAEDMLLDYQKKMENAKQEANSIKDDLTSAAKLEAERIITNAKEKAHDMLQKTSEDIKLYNNEAKEKLSDSVVELAVSMAAKILEREVKQSDNDSIITGIIEEWKKG